MKKLLAVLSALFMVTATAGCMSLGGESGGLGGSGGSGGSGDASLHILAATELKDLEPLIQQAADDLGKDISVSYDGGTLENSQGLKDGGYDGTYDATWFATNRYADLIGASDALADQYPLANSPIALGVRSDLAQQKGWVDNPPTWDDLVAAADAGELSFGMTDPTASNSGFSTVVSAATALADTGLALTEEDINRVAPQLQTFFSSQTVSSGSSGWLADTFAQDPTKADAIFNYESTLFQLKKAGQDIEVVVPADGTITADYPLSALKHPQNTGSGEAVRELADWFQEHQQEVADTYRRPVQGVDTLPAELARHTPIELPFPATENVTTQLLDKYNGEFRMPGQSTFLLDTSGSMEGERLASLKRIMHELIGGTAATSTGDVSFRDRESVELLPFNDALEEGASSVIADADPASRENLDAFVNNLEPGGYTATYAALEQVLTQQAAAKAKSESTQDQNEKTRTPTVVLLSDGQATAEPFYDQFVADYGQHPEWSGIPVFVILYGEANRGEMEQLAQLTGGKVFDAQNGDLAETFKEIRGYQ